MVELVTEVLSALAVALVVVPCVVLERRRPVK